MKESEMKRQTVLEYVRERKMQMYENICPMCNSHLDFGEKCKCQLIDRAKKNMKLGKRVKIELNNTYDFPNVRILKVSEQEITVEDLTGRTLDIDVDSLTNVC